MGRALLRVGSADSRSGAAPAPKPRSARRVLLAGFPETQQKALLEALRERFDVWVWKAVNGSQAFQSLVKQCGVVVFPEEVDDDVEAGLKDMDVRVIRHAGSASRLIERLGELG